MLFFMRFSLLFFSLFGCSPTFNWREVVSQEPSYVALFPAKPAQMTKTISLGRFDIPLTLRAAEVNGLYFAVGIVPLNQETLAHTETLKKLLAIAMANNAGVIEPHLQFLNWAGLLTLHLKVGTHQIVRKPNNASPENAIHYMEARFFSTQGYIFEVFIIGKSTVPPPDVVAQWFDGFRLQAQEKGRF